MTILSSLAIFYGAVFILVGLSALQPNTMRALFDNLEKNRGLLWLTGLVTFLMGLVSLMLYRQWSGGVGTLVTLLGWLTLLKGLTLTLVPGWALSLYKGVTSTTLFRIAGLVAIVLGLLCFYLAQSV